MIGGPSTHHHLHQPSAFGLLMTRNAPVVAHHSLLPSSTTNSTISPSVPITQSPRSCSSYSNPQSQQIQRVVPNMLQAPIDRSVIEDYFRAQSTILEPQSNNNNLHSNEGGDTTVHNDNSDDNDFPMQFDTTEDRPPKPDFSSTHLNDLEKKKIHPSAESQAWTFNRN